MHQPVSVQLLRPGARVPTYGSDGAAGADLYACLEEPATILPGQTRMISLGIAMAIPVGWVGLVFARSGMAAKRDLAPANKVGVIDPDYRGEFFVALHNHGSEPRIVEPGERIAQLVLVPYLTAEFRPCESLPETQRGAGGFGSTGTR